MKSQLSASLKNTDIIQYLADGYTMGEIGEKENTCKRSIEQRIRVLKERHLCKTVTQLVINYYKKGLID